MADNNSLTEALVHVRSLLVDLERHIDKAAADGDLAQVGRAWVRAVQVERILRDALPAEAKADLPDVELPPRAADPRSHSDGG